VIIRPVPPIDVHGAFATEQFGEDAFEFLCLVGCELQFLAADFENDLGYFSFHVDAVEQSKTSAMTTPRAKAKVSPPRTKRIARAAGFMVAQMFHGEPAAGPDRGSDCSGQRAD
jgi:hypothetical protein